MPEDCQSVSVEVTFSNSGLLILDFNALNIATKCLHPLFQKDNESYKKKLFSYQFSSFTK